MSLPIDYLSQFDMLQIRTRLAAEQHETFEVMNLNGLQSALAAPRQAVFGQELHPLLWDKAAALLILLIKNHPFYDGNKRIAVLGVCEFLRRNGWELMISQAEATAFTKSIVLGRDDISEVSAWLQGHARQLDHSRES